MVRLKIVVVLILVLIGFIAGGYLALAKGVPSIDELKKYRANEGTKVFADDNSLIAEFKVEKGIFVPLQKIPAHLTKAVVAVEDSRFWSHKGLDYIGIGRALLTDLIHGSIKEGGSTITQQLAKVLFLTPERTIQRKLREARLAMKLEEELSKNEILELYLNRIYFGHGAYGIEMAAKTYFGKSVSHITLPEAALLAGLIKAPNVYSPYNNLVKAKERQEIVLERMEKEGYLTAAERERAKKQSLSLSSMRASTEANSYFTEYVRQLVEQRFGEEMVYKGNLRVYTTLDQTMQFQAQRALQEGLRDVDKRRGWRGPISHRDVVKGENDDPRVAFSASVGDIATGVVIAVNQKEAKVKARGITGTLSVSDALWASRVVDQNSGKITYVKNFGLTGILQKGDVIWVRFKSISGKDVTLSLEQEPEIEGSVVVIEPETGFIRALVGGYSFTKSEFNRALYAKRQPGSAFKPIVYAAALEQGYTPASIVNDEPVSYPGGPSGEWKPENYDRQYYGPTRLREALAYSRNIVTIKLADAVGIDNVISFAKRAGIQTTLPRDLSIALGSVGVAPVELALAYATLANGGERMNPTALKYVTDSRGRVLEEYQPEGVEAVSPQTAFLVTSMMQDVIQYGTGMRAQIGRPAAGKTGTSNDYRDAWFVGYTPELLACVWVGFDDMKRTLGSGEAGGRAAAPIWARFMRSVKAGEGDLAFQEPSGIVRLPIDPATGLLAHEWQSSTYEYFSDGTQPREFSKSVRRVERQPLKPDFD